MSKSKRSQLGKQKQIRNILILAAVVIVIAAAIFLYIALQKDGAGMNCFQRSATAASANGVKATMGEYRMALDSNLSSGYTTGYSDAEIRAIQENAAKSVLLQKMYRNQAKKLGLSLTDEQKAACKKSAQEQIDNIEAYFAQYLDQQGNYAKSALENQLTSYYQSIGMSKNEYYDFMRSGMEADYYRQAIEAYYNENEEKIDEAELLAFYREAVEKAMYTTDDNGEKVSTYEDGMFWSYLALYSYGYYSTPLLYAPEGSIFVDYIMLNKDSIEDAEAIINKINSGEMSFDELMASEDNVNPYKAVMAGPYPITKNDHAGLFTDEEAYETAASLAEGEIKPFIVNSGTEDNASAVVVYLFRGAKGTICMNGESGILNIDAIKGVRSIAENEFRVDSWLGEIKYEDALYAYKGALG